MSRDFVISFFASTPLLRSALGQLASEPVLLEPQVRDRQYKAYVSGNGNSILGLWRKAAGQSGVPGRVAVLGFSEGCQGVRACLETTDATAIDAIFPCDGVHAAYPDRLTRLVQRSMLAPYVAYGRLASAFPPSTDPNVKLMVVSHSAIVPGTFASTTETAEIIWSDVMADAPAQAEKIGPHEDALASVIWPDEDLPIGTVVAGGTMTAAGWTTIRRATLGAAPFTWSGFADGWTQRRVANNMHLYGWSYPTPNGTRDPTGDRDHVFQANMVLPYAVTEFLVSRWNGPSLGFTRFASGASGTGVSYEHQAQRPLTDPYAGMVVVTPTKPRRCEPEPGSVVVGSATDPCSSAPVQATTAAPSVLPWFMGAAGAAVGFYGARRILR